SNVLDLSGPQFLLVFFAVIFPIGIAIASVIRWHFRRPVDEPTGDAPQLDPDELAYLAGGRETAFNAAIASLVSRSALQLAVTERRLYLSPQGADWELSPVEQSVLRYVDPVAGASVDEIRRARLPFIEMADHLESLGLIVSGGRAWLGRFLPLGVMSAVLAAG